jgi:heme o synthase
VDYDDSQLPDVNPEVHPVVHRSEQRQGEREGADLIKPDVRQSNAIPSPVTASPRWPDLSHRKEIAKTLTAYFKLTKPGIIVGNGITTLAGFFLAAKDDIHVALLVATVAGVSLVIASACVLNNCIDMGIDAKMMRTQSRSLVTGAASAYSAAIFAGLLGMLGFTILGIFTNVLTMLAGIVGVFFYVSIYTLVKRFSHWSTIVGSVSGALPPLAGYTAVAGRLDGAALFLFALMVLWQMPHFYALAIYRLDEYRAAGIPILPATQGIFVAKVHMVLYTTGFALVCTIFFFTEFPRDMFPSLVVLLSLGWLMYIGRGFGASNNRLWARHIFVFSLVVIVFLCISIVAVSSLV